MATTKMGRYSGFGGMKKDVTLVPTLLRWERRWFGSHAGAWEPGEKSLAPELAQGIFVKPRRAPTEGWSVAPIIGDFKNDR
jgi:hypothetical protein